MNACKEVLSLWKIELNVIGLKKDNNHKLIAIVFNDCEYVLNKSDDLYLLLVNISQTVHDFAISFFRSTKAKGMFVSRLDGIKNLGPKKKEKLIKHFITIDNIKNASIDQFKEIGINEDLAKDILNHLNESNKDE